MGVASPCLCATSSPRTYRSSIFFARFVAGLRAFLASSLPAPGGRTEERGGTSATEAPATEDRRDPRRVARVFACSGPRGCAGRADGGTHHDDDDEGRGTGESDRDGRGDDRRDGATNPRRAHRLAPASQSCPRRWDAERGCGRAGAEGDAPRRAAAEADADRG